MLHDPRLRATSSLPCRPARVVLAGVLLAGCGAADDPGDQVVDVTRLYRIDVQRVAQPHDIDEVVHLVRTHDGPISIGGGRFSMGGQTAAEHTMQIDMRQMNDVLDFDADAKTITVEAGARWRDIQEHIDPHDLSVQIMQSYANFSVGGSLSVNAHGRYVNQGPAVHSVREIELVLADGSRVVASREQNSDLFFGAIGGYGSLGVIAHVTLNLDPNVKVERVHELMPLPEYRQWFVDTIEGSDVAVFHNADLYPPDYTDVVAITFQQTDDPVTVEDRLQQTGSSTFLERTLYWAVMDLPGGKSMRENWYDPYRLGSKHVVWRNYEASYDAFELEPASREKRTYVLQEYFVPVDNLEAFAADMAEIFQRFDVDVANVSIRHAIADPDTLMTWAPVESYAFVIYYRQHTAEHARTEVGIWTREMIDAVLEADGTWYLPYQPHGTQEQFHQGYPRANELWALKARVDPDYRFRNNLWNTYYWPPTDPRVVRDDELHEQLLQRDDWLRPEDQTWLTLPEWYIVYSADELGAHLAKNQPSTFPFFQAISQFWTIYTEVDKATGRYEFNTGYHGMIWVIGTSYTVEYAVKGLWEHSVGRLTEWWNGTGPNTLPEEQFIGQLAIDYGAFIHHTPWYAFPWWTKKQDLAKVPRTVSLRGEERRFVTWVELIGKGLWGDAMGSASQGVYGAEATHMLAWVRDDGIDVTEVDGVEVLEDLGDGDLLLKIPRYEPFTTAVPALARKGVRFVEIAGNSRLLITVKADDSWDTARLYGYVVHSWPILTEPGHKLVAMEVPVQGLHEVLPLIEASGGTLHHLYDY